MLKPAHDLWQWLVDGCVVDIKMSIAGKHLEGKVPTERQLTGLIWQVVCGCVRDGLSGEDNLISLCWTQDAEFVFLGEHFLHDQALVMAMLICANRRKQDLDTATVMTLALRVFDAVVAEMGIMRKLALCTDAFRARYIDS